MMPTFSYPLFEENQVLSYQHLNSLAAFLENNDRSTRRALIGAGIVDGLDLGWESAAGVRLAPGAALTTGGDLCHLEVESVFTAARAYTDPSAYGPFIDPSDSQQYDLWELVGPVDAIASDTALTGAAGGTFLQTRSALLFLEVIEADLDTCIDNHCVNQGSEYRLSWRVLLGARTDLDAMRNAALAGTVPWPAWSLADVRFERLSLGQADVLTHDALARKGTSFLGRAAAELRTALREAIPLYGSRFGVSATVSNRAVAALESGFDTWLAQLPGADYLRWQHGLDHVRHLYLAWAAFVDAAFSYQSSPSPLFEPFERHVLLGDIPPAVFPPPSPRRHRFIPSPALTLAGADRELCRLRFLRLLALATHFSVTAGAGVRITPGAALGALLDDQAVPFYYTTTEVLGSWSQAATYRGRTRRLPCYHRETLERVPYAQDPLRYRVAEPGFYRVEGHLGLPRSTVEQALADARGTYNLPFDVVTLVFGPREQEQAASCLCDLDQVKGAYLVTAAELDAT